jgi:hypothetical protein
MQEHFYVHFIVLCLFNGFLPVIAAFWPVSAPEK